MTTIKVILHEKLSTNQIYRMHHHAKAQFQQAMNISVLSAVRNQKIKPITKYPVICTYVFYATGKTLDVLNVAGMAKALEDSMRYAKIFKDDSLKYIKQVTLLEEVSDQKYSYMILEID